MSNFQQCSTCKEWDWLKSHQCLPIWEVRCPEWFGDDDIHDVYARRAEDAVTKWAEEHDDEHLLSDGGATTIEVHVRKDEDHPWQKFSCYGEPQIHYYASEAD